MKKLECTRRRIFHIGFIDPYIVNDYTLEHHPQDVENDLYTFLIKQNECRSILFPLRFR